MAIRGELDVGRNKASCISSCGATTRHPFSRVDREGFAGIVQARLLGDVARRG